MNKLSRFYSGLPSH